MLVNAFKTSDKLCVEYVMIVTKIPVVFGSVDVRQVNGFAEASVEMASPVREWERKQLRGCESGSGSEPTNL
jgi:hypothetical protein